MFSTLLGPLRRPRGDAPSETPSKPSNSLAATGLELITDGLDPAPRPTARPTPSSRRAAAGRPVGGGRSRLRSSVRTPQPARAGLDPRVGRPRRIQPTIVGARRRRLCLRRGRRAGRPGDRDVAVGGERRFRPHTRACSIAAGRGPLLAGADRRQSRRRRARATFFDLGYASFAFDLIAGPDNWRSDQAQAPADLRDRVGGGARGLAPTRRRDAASCSCGQRTSAASTAGRGDSRGWGSPTRRAEASPGSAGTEIKLRQAGNRRRGAKAASAAVGER